MLKLLKKVTIPVVLILMVATLCVPVMAATGFSVSLVFPENQRQSGSAFFDLLVRPGQVQDLVVSITNSGDEDAAMLVDVITASTGFHGEINYTDRGGLMDESLQFSLEDLMDWPLEPVVVPAGVTVDVPIRLTVPMERFDGILLGAITIVREVTQDERDAAGAIVNQFGYVTAVRLMQSENAENIPADFALGDITAELTHHRASIVAQIRNTQPKFIRGASASMEIFEQGSSVPIFRNEIERLEMAPNSIFSYLFVDYEGRGMRAGDYTAAITLEFERQTWNWEQEFTITPEVAEMVNESAINLVETGWWDYIPILVIIIVGVLIIFISLMSIMMVKTSKANKRANEQLRKMAEK